MNNIIYVSFYTEGIYEKVINKYLLPSLKKYNLPYKIYKKPNLKEWNQNTRFKANIILEALEEFLDNDIIFIDADNVIVEFPELFYKISQEYDLALFYLDWYQHWRNQTGNSKRELCNGVALFRNNNKVKELIKEWIEKDKVIGGLEQKILQDLLDNHPEIKIYKLPVEYSVIPLQDNTIPTYIGKPIIRAYPFSRQIRTGKEKL